MRQNLKKAISVFLAVAMLLCAAPLNGFVGLDLPSLFDFKAEAASYSGTCGDNLTWSLDADTGVLEITGTGEMTNWSYLSSAPWYSYRSDIKTVNIASGVTSIGSYAFYYCSSLTSVTIPDSVTSIGSFTFYYCRNLTSLTIGNSVTSIGYSAFRNCSSLTSVTIPDSVTTICDEVFSDCSSLTSVTIPDSVTTIGDYAFSNCSSLTSVTIPDGVTTIGDYAFFCCSSLTSVTIGNSVTSIGSATFSGCSNLTSITIPDSVTIIGSSAFYGCGSLTSVTIGNSVTIIGSSAFYDCSSLTSVTIGNSVTSIGYSAFCNCSSLTSITIPDSVTSIGNYAFSGCRSLISVTIPDSVTSVGNYAFSICSSLTSVTIPDSVSSVGNCAFSGCSSLTSVTIGNSVTSVGKDAFSGCNNLTSITIPDSVTSIGSSAFYGCSSLTSITIGNSVTSIGSATFYSCSNLTSITIPDSVTSIGSSAFYGCSSLTSINISENVLAIEDNAFKNAPNVQLIIRNNLYAVNYAVENNIPFIIVGGTHYDEKNTIFERESTYYSLNSSNRNGSIVLNLDYNIIDDVFSDISNPEIIIKLPENSNILAIKCDEHDIDSDSYNCKNGILTIELTDKLLTKNLTKLRVHISLEGYTSIFSHARIKYVKDSETYTETIGYINVDEIAVSISGSSATGSTKAYKFYGVAPTNTDVDIFVDGKKVTSVKSNAVGSYSGEIDLPNSENGHNYLIKAKCAVNGKTAGNSYYVKYIDGSAKLTEFDFIYNGKTYDLINGDIHTITFAPSYKYHFEINFSNNENIREVLVTSQRNGVNKVLNAIWNEEKQAFVTEGNFDPRDPNYVPGEINVYYCSHSGDVFESIVNDMEDKLDFSIAPPESLQGIEVTGLETSDPNHTRIDVSINGEEAYYCQNIYTYEEYNQKYPISITTQSSVGEVIDTVVSELITLHTISGKTITAAKKGEDFVLTCLNESADEVVEYIVSNNLEEMFSEPVSDVLMSVNGVLEDTFDLPNEISEYNNLFDFYEELINSSTVLTPEEKEYELKYLAISKASVFVDVVGNYLASLTTDGWEAVVSVAGVGWTGFMFEAIGMHTEKYSERNIQEEIDKLNERYSQTKATENSVKPNFYIDPSGIVTDSETGLPLENVKATVYYKGENGEAVFWNAGDFDQANPQMTNEIGYYHWDVPEGEWQVKYEKEGYVTAYSEWLPVPPPQTEVNISLDPIKYTVSWIIGNEKIVDSYRAGEEIVIPESPNKAACVFVGWDGEIPSLMPPHDLEFIAQFKSDINYFAIKQPSVATINYGETLVMHVDFGEDKLPEGWSIQWSIDGNGFNMSPAEDGLTCKLTSSANGNATVKATLVDENGEVVLDMDGNEMSDSKQLTSKAGFWQKLVSFFKNLFGVSRVILQSI